MSTTHDQQHAAHVPPGRDVVDLRQEARAEHVDEPVQGDDHGVGEEDVALRERVVEPQVHERRDERRRPEVDRRSDGDLADEVEPAGEPAPPGTAQARRPVVEAAGRRIGRGDLAHRERDEDAEAADEQPAPRDRDRPTPADGDVVRRQAAGQDGDDGERDGEVREAAPAAQKLLGVAEAVERALVLGQVGEVIASGRWRSAAGGLAAARRCRSAGGTGIGAHEPSLQGLPFGRD